MRKAVYAGGFDPPTNGHLWMIEEGARLFDELVVAIGINPDKKYTFSLDERVDMLRRSTRQFPNVKIDSFENEFLVNYASSVNARYILRGLRTGGDYEYERGMRHINSDINPKIVTPFFIPPRELIEVSSSFVKGLVGPNRWEEVVKGYVPRSVYNSFLVKFRGLQKRWNALWERIDADGSGEDAYNELVSLYGETQRAYHNFVHIAHVLRELDGARNLIENPEQVEVALWYHDAVYNTREKGNEEKSAELAEQRLSKAGLKPQFIDGVIALILSTEHQAMPQGSDEKHLVDIDLSILGKSQKEFDEYERDIRDEYAWVADEQFRQERSTILQVFLDRDSIYSTDFFRQKYEKQARRNVERSIAQLRI
ncbi:MAG: pantetheine-phosphate adenylyltransferase [Candidatus Aenigmarchaeota archaeon]|nr:pantetheine-phosphate adenylyltransferase [Candidatus Aenigmarchaeota archaeon]